MVTEQAHPTAPPGLQPPTPASSASSLRDPVEAADIDAGLLGAHRTRVAKLQEQLERRLADQTLVAEMAEQAFQGPKYDRFADELAAYGMGVMRGWLHSGYAFAISTSRGYPLRTEERDLHLFATDATARTDLAVATVAKALPSFRERALLGGGWQPARGASVTTYFMGACAYSFPNEFRRQQAQRRRWERDSEIGYLASCRTDSQAIDTSALAVGDLRVREELHRLPPRTAAVLALTLDGYSQQEIAELTDGSSTRAVEGVLHRWRKDARERLDQEGEL